MSRWSLAASWPVIGVGVGVMLGAVWLSLLNLSRNRGRKFVAGLEALRLAVVGLVVITLWRPELARQVRPSDRPEVVVLCDTSRSMTTKDVVADATTVMSRTEWVDQQRAAPWWGSLSNRFRVVVEEFGRADEGGNAAGTGVGGKTEPTPSPSKEGNAGTDLGGALEGVLAGHRDLRAVVLMSDGDWNAGRPPSVAATALRVQDVPVFAVAVGSQQYLPDLALEEVSAPAYGLMGEQVYIGFKVRSYLSREVRTAITLRGPQGAMATKDLVIPAGGEVADAVFWTPAAEGAAALSLKLPVEKDELRGDNNEQSFQVTVRKEVLKVLVVESAPRWEYRFLRNALLRDPGVEVQCVLFHPGMKPGQGRGYLEDFPHTKDALSTYDVVFLGDVGIGPGELTAADAESLKGLVEQQGSGLVFIPGLRGRERSLASSPLGELMPVELGEADPAATGTATPSHVALTQRGRGHWLTMLASSEEENARIWQRLPGFYWHAAVTKTRPGAEVLAVHEGLRNQWGRIPLLVTRPYGNGKVLFLGIDSAWRWRRGVEDTYHYRFWGQVVRWMAYQRHLARGQGLRVAYQPDSPQLGQTVRLQATVADTAGMPLRQGRVTAEVSAPNGHRERFELAAVAGGWGVFEGEFAPQQTGQFTLRVRSESTGREMESPILVRGQAREQVGRPARPDVLREIAGITGGQLGEPAEVAKFADRIAALPVREPMARRLRLWCHPAWGGVIVGLLAAYWVGRKLAGLV